MAKNKACNLQRASSNRALAEFPETAVDDTNGATRVSINGPGIPTPSHPEEGGNDASVQNAGVDNAGGVKLDTEAVDCGSHASHRTLARPTSITRVSRGEQRGDPSDEALVASKRPFTPTGPNHLLTSHKGGSYFNAMSSLLICCREIGVLED